LLNQKDKVTILISL